MLHVAVHRDDGVSDGKVHAAGDGDLVAEIARKGQRPHMRVAGGQLVDQLVRAILRAIIDVDDLVVHIQCLHDFCHFVMEIDDVAFFIIYRCYDRYHGSSVTAHKPTLYYSTLRYIYK